MENRGEGRGLRIFAVPIWISRGYHLWGHDWGRARLIHAARKPNSAIRDMDLSPVDDRQEVAIETANDPVFTAEQIGWRFALGTLVLVGAYAAWPLIPVVMMTDLAPGAKAGLIGIVGRDTVRVEIRCPRDHGTARLLFSEAQPFHAHSPLGGAPRRIISKREEKNKGAGLRPAPDAWQAQTLARLVAIVPIAAIHIRVGPVPAEIGLGRVWHDTHAGRR